MPLIIETPFFTSQLTALYKKRRITPSQYRLLQSAIVEGTIRAPRIRGAKGAKKLRWKTTHGGKSSGVRLIFYHHPSHDLFYFLYMYEKSAEKSLTDRQRAVLGDLITQLQNTLDD